MTLTSKISFEKSISHITTRFEIQLNDCPYPHWLIDAFVATIQIKKAQHFC